MDGGYSKLERYVIKNTSISKIHSWVDLRYGTGKSLEVLGYRACKIVASWRWTDYKRTFNRLFCRANMDDRHLSESDRAREMGLVRIYDAGQQLFVKEVVRDI